MGKKKKKKNSLGGSLSNRLDPSPLNPIALLRFGNNTVMRLVGIKDYRKLYDVYAYLRERKKKEKALIDSSIAGQPT